MRDAEASIERSGRQHHAVGDSTRSSRNDDAPARCKTVHRHQPAQAGQPKLSSPKPNTSLLIGKCRVLARLAKQPPLPWCGEPATAPVIAGDRAYRLLTVTPYAVTIGAASLRDLAPGVWRGGQMRQQPIGSMRHAPSRSFSCNAFADQARGDSGLLDGVVVVAAGTMRPRQHRLGSGRLFAGLRSDGRSHRRAGVTSCRQGTSLAGESQRCAPRRQP